MDIFIDFIAFIVSAQRQMTDFLVSLYHQFYTKVEIATIQKPAFTKSEIQAIFQGIGIITVCFLVFAIVIYIALIIQEHCNRKKKK